jgi:hypothetical protein
MRIIIRDSRQRPIGFIENTANGSKMYDRTGSTLISTYNKYTNSTYSSIGKLVGKGNQLYPKK